MHTRPLQESPLASSARTVYHGVRAIYRNIRAIGNRLLNLLDKPIIILLYHRVADLQSDPEMLAVSPANFRRHMEFLKHHFRILRFDEDWSGHAKPAVVITFDDGYADNLHEAMPIISEVGVPVTFFVSTGHIGTSKVFWWNRLEEILLRDGEFQAYFKLNDPRYGREWPTETLQQRLELYHTLSIRMLKLTADHREDWLVQLKKWAVRDDPYQNVHRSMTQDEIKRLAANQWTSIGAHTVTHPVLSTLGEEQQRHEILTSKQDLEDLTGLEITTFSYPFGRKRDYNRISIRLCREAGFTKAASNFPGQVHKWSDPFQLPRHLVRNWDIDTFADQLESFWTR